MRLYNAYGVAESDWRVSVVALVSLPHCTLVCNQRGSPLNAFTLNWPAPFNCTVNSPLTALTLGTAWLLPICVPPLCPSHRLKMKWHVPLTGTPFLLSWLWY